jgi:hypothetical protein
MVAVEPFDDTHLEGAALGLWARQTAVMLGNGSPLVEMHSPVIRRPYATVGPQQRD